ncbi:hypothetical protein QCA50_002619 [Cerrena zonata]|uniref:Uncharacterized protein n=1 Tax=Cerrena zonata TaxID=2478898 RepID=A0AAW0GUE7_9APHY
MMACYHSKVSFDRRARGHTSAVASVAASPRVLSITLPQTFSAFNVNFITILDTIMDVRHYHGSDVHVVRACHTGDGAGLVAIGGMHSVQVLQTTPTSCKVIANFHIGCQITALAWSPKSTSPSFTDEWDIELVAAGSERSLYLLTKTSSTEEDIFIYGGGLSGHHAKINDISYAGGESDISHRFVASVSDDRTLLIWDLTPEVKIPSPGSPESDGSDAPSRPQPTAYPIAFPHPLASVSSHPSTSKDLLVADNRGSLFVVDWRTDENERASWRNSSIVELVEPHALADAACGVSKTWSASAAWRADSADIIGATYGSKFALWDLNKLNGGKPTMSGTSFTEGGNRFRWCPTFPEYFGISTNSPTKGAVINVHNTTYIHTEPNSFAIAPRPLFVRDFDFLSTPGIPRIVAAVGREVVMFSIGVE